MADATSDTSVRGRGRGRGVRRANVGDNATVRPGGEGPETVVGERSCVPSGQGSTGEAKSSNSSDSSSSGSFATRPGFGTVGRAVILRSNNFVVDITKSPAQVYQYRVDISSDYKRKLKKEDHHAIFWEAVKSCNLAENQYTLLYDGGNICFSLRPLNITDDKRKCVVEVSLPQFGRPGKYSVTIMLTGQPKIDYNDSKTRQASLMVLDLVFRQFYNLPMADIESKKFHPFGRSFFSRPSSEDKCGFDLDAGRQVWGGYFFAVKLGVDTLPIINIDVANSVFIKKQSVLQFMCDVLNEAKNINSYHVGQLEKLTKPYYLSSQESQVFSKAIKGFMVTCKAAPNRPQKVHSLTSQLAENLMFEWKQGETVRSISVAQYFAERYQKLRYPFFPCLEVGTKARKAYLPLEVCDMYTPQRVGGKLTEQQTSAMIKGVCTDAPERESRIRDVMRRAELEQDPFARQFGCKINLSMMETQGRVLPAPSLEYSNNRASPRDGSWIAGGSTKFFACANIASYGVVSFMAQSCQGELKTFCEVLMQQAQHMGVRVDNIYPACVRWISDSNGVRQAISDVLKECSINGQTCAFILVPMYSKSTENYAGVKSVAEKEFGVVTQVVIQRNIRQPKPQTCGNIVLKINAKLGGVNWKLSPDEITRKYLINQPTLILGIDVTHPAPSDRKAPSIGAAVGNIDTLPAKFGASVSVQKHRREAVVYLSDAIQKRVSQFYQQTQRKPERIIVYRDGVAETQFREVLTEETKSILQACAALGGGDFKPKITFIVVQKRHHTRFFCSRPQDTCGKAKNVPPGTVVDNVVTHPSQFDFFLCSHFGIQGTSRPAHYHVLRDDNNFTSDELHAISYHLCHMYVRCTRSVSIPAPTYYAHLACARARLYLRELLGDGLSDTVSETSGSSDSGSSTEEEIKKAVDVAESLTTKMYFC